MHLLTCRYINFNIERRRKKEVSVTLYPQATQIQL